jgi:Tetratricopeptide repeat
VLAEPLYKECLEVKKETLGSDHPDTLVALNNLAILYHDNGLCKWVV